jgi:integrase
MSVVSVRATDIRKWHEHLINKGLKRQTITIARVLLKEAFDIAMIDEIVETNPIKIVDMPKMKSIKKKHKPFTLDEIDLLLASSDGFVKNFLGISFFTGMRSGELLALRWDDVDFTTDTISITKTIAEGIINEPKTNSSYREIEMLDKAKEFFKSQRLQTGLKNEYVFLNSNGAYYGNNSTIYYKYCTLLKELGLEHRSLHNTRHTFASIMLNNGIEPMWVSNTLGHENLDITLKIYAHFMPRKEKMSIKFLEKRYKSGTM